MTTTGEMIEVGGVGGEQHRHGGVTLTAVNLPVAKRGYRAPTMAFPVDHPTPQRPVVDLFGGSRLMARARPWRLDPHTATLTIMDPQPIALAVDAAVWLARLNEAGYRRVRTSAVSPSAAVVLERFGFSAVQRLTVLNLGPVALSQHGAVPATSPWRVRTLRWRTDALRPRREVQQALEVDRLAFGDGWCLDTHAWRDAVQATPQRRITVVEHDDQVVGFAITGATDRDSFLQRLAVSPAVHRRGVARSLVNDAVAWVARTARRQLLVNTAQDNTAAIALYESMGFQRRPDELVVLEGPTSANADEAHG